MSVPSTVLAVLLVVAMGLARLSAAPMATNVVRILSTNGTVEVLRAGAQTWDFASPLPEKNLLHVGDQLRTGPNSHARIQMADRTIVPIGPNGHLQILRAPERRAAIRLIRGLFFFLHRDEPGEVEVLTPTVSAVIRGTEFTVNVAADGATELRLLDGLVDLTNEFGRIELTSGQAAEIRPGQSPSAVPMLAAAHTLQWFLYYPGILYPGDLPLTESARIRLDDSLKAYLTGDLRAALAAHPAEPAPQTDGEKVYLAALLLGVGDVPAAETQLDQLKEPGESSVVRQLATALRRLMDSVKSPATITSSGATASLATAWLAESYVLQSASRLEAAREAAREAVRLAPEFGFARARLAELEFGFGRLTAARVELERALQLSPRHAQAMALRGFVLAGENRLDAALAAFDQAISLDAGLGNAWLGRGLVQIRRGRLEDGRRDVEVAAAAEPQRGLFRSYLGKALTDERELAKAAHELDLARQLDPADPTAWLYAALLNQTHNRINEAIRDLETSQSLNDHRNLYRSRSLLDQDKSVRGANLAAIYRDAGMTDVAFRTAARAVQDDYANFSSHLFLANSYQQLRDPGQVNLRYETPWLSEYLVANLLAPVGAGTLSQIVSDQDYSRLFERNRLGIVSQTEYRDNGDWIQSGALYGLHDNASFALEEFYRSENGMRRNNDQERLTLSFQLKQQVTAQDALYFQAIYGSAEAGDRAQYYRPSEANAALRIEEQQEPILLAGYHHDWAPGMHTLALASRLHDQFALENPTQPFYLHYLTNGVSSYVDIFPQPLDYESELAIYSFELQQILTFDPFRFIVGTREQFGEFETRNRMPGFFFIPATNQTVSSDFLRLNAYAYLQWQPVETLRLLGGVAYDHLKFPENFRRPPISANETTEDQVSPKVGLVWDVGPSSTVRAAYARSLGGVSIDQSFQLEPSQIAGFIQSYRSILPESAAGPVAGSRFDIWGVALDHQFPTDTYLGLSAEWLSSSATRHAGFYEADEDVSAGLGAPPTVRSRSTPERLDFDERSLSVTLNQLVGTEWALGARYRVSDASFDGRFPRVPAGTPAFGGFERVQQVEGTLQEVRLYGLFNHACGLFAGADSVWMSQSNRGYNPDRPGDDFWQFNVHVGYRWLHRRVETRISLLNLTDRDYRLNPLNLTTELPRERTLAMSLRFSF
jgi:outer membrane receptor protein involved in Fe transport